MSQYILINFEGSLDTGQRDDIENAVDVPIAQVRNIRPYPTEGITVEDYVFTVVKNILDPKNDWENPAFLIRPPDASPIFSTLFIEALDAATGASLAILDIQYTDDFPPKIASETNAVPLRKIKQKARQLRYTPEV